MLRDNVVAVLFQELVGAVHHLARIVGDAKGARVPWRRKPRMPRQLLAHCMRQVLSNMSVSKSKEAVHVSIS